MSDVPQPKPGHTQRYSVRVDDGTDTGQQAVGHVTAGPFGPTVYLIVDHTGTLLDWRASRHEAVGRVAELPAVNDHEILPVPVGSVPIGDVRSVRRVLQGETDE